VRLSEPLREGLVKLCADNLSAGVRACIILTRYHKGYDADTPASVPTDDPFAAMGEER